MKTEQLLTWVSDNNINEEINIYITEQPKTLDTIKWILNYINTEFKKINITQEMIFEQTEAIMAKTSKTSCDDVFDVLANNKLLDDIGEQMESLDFIATFIEDHTEG